MVRVTVKENFLSNMTVKTLDTLVADIQTLIKRGLDDPLPSGKLLGEEVSELYSGRLLNNDERDERTLRMSNLGVPCERKLWYSIHKQHHSEDYDASTLFKFHFGDYIESVLLRLAKDAGHDVRGEQDEMEIRGVKGHRDCVIDGVTVDVKSASSNSFKKFRDGLEVQQDSFGYLTQLKSYVRAGRDDPNVVNKTTGAFLVVDKQHGHICLDVHKFSQEEIDSVDELVEHKKRIVSDKETTPPRGFDPVPDGKSGNLKLGVNCSYCSFKDLCHPNLRTFIYSTGPRYMTKVSKTPKVDEAR